LVDRRRPASQTGPSPWQGCLRAVEYHADRIPPGAGQTGCREVPRNDPGREDPLILAPRERHRQGTGTELSWVLAVCCLGSAHHWWLRLLWVFPVEDSEPGSVFGPIIGDPDLLGYYLRSRGSRS